MSIMSHANKSAFGMFVLECGDCDAKLQNESRAAMEDEAKGIGWKEINGRPFCPVCAAKQVDQG